MRQFFLDRRREAVLIPALVLALSVVTFVATRLHATYRNSSDIALLIAKVDGCLADQESERQKLRGELDEINRTLYEAMVDVQATKTAAAGRRPSSVEAWMINRTTVLQKRIDSLERRLYQLEK